MMFVKRIVLTGIVLVCVMLLHAQETPWQGKKSAVVLTYDDGYDEQ